jgi:hypothetical protein
MIKCKNCEFWDMNIRYGMNYHPLKNNYGNCKCEKFIYSFLPNDSHEIDCLIYSDYEEYEAGFCTGSDFGCIHGIKK